ncbi:cobalt-precorrin-6A reductase [Nocardia thailandica]|uniref:cobalt-precorrin-6A reductase n=1 Tax=Nocardia thailandica TaxID=257275 RepID=UPI001C3F2C44|nr:cobalt-precorrin-6A reductase [Nocardia thailandica]
MNILILGGTGEARSLARLASDEPGLTVVSSLAGRVGAPVLPDGQVRVGGFGGVDGLRTWLRDNEIDAIVDATHPFAAAITANAVAAAAAEQLPLVVLRRPGWRERPGDLWRRVPDLHAAAGALGAAGRRVFLTVGRQGVAAFADRADCHFLIRAIDAPAPPLPERHEILLARGPFSLDDEMLLLTGHRIDVLVTKDSGGPLTEAKLTAARTVGVPVVMVDRPPLPAGVVSVATPFEAMEWVRAQRPKIAGSRSNQSRTARS